MDIMGLGEGRHGRRGCLCSFLLGFLVGSALPLLLAERDQVVRNLCIEIMFEKCSPFEGRGAEERKKVTEFLLKIEENYHDFGTFFFC